MNRFKITGTCTIFSTADIVTSMFSEADFSYVHPFSYVVTGQDEADAYYTANIWAIEEAESLSGFPTGRIVGNETKVANIRQLTETDILLTLPRELAPMFPGF
jgi:hypothetical protein